jgi:hypothetical protein
VEKIVEKRRFRLAATRSAPFYGLFHVAKVQNWLVLGHGEPLHRRHLPECLDESGAKVRKSLI